MGTEKKNIGHWDNVFSELNDDVVNSQEETSAEETVSDAAPAEEAESAKPKRGRKAAVKKRAVKKTAAKRGTRVPKGIEFLDSPDQVRLDLTVGAEKKRTAVRRRGRGKSTVSEAADLIEKAEEAERIQATETVRSIIAAQLGGLVQEKASESEAEKAPAEVTAEEIAADAEPVETAAPEKADAPEEKTLTFEDFFGGETETLEISWGRPPKAVFAEEPVQEPDREPIQEQAEESAAADEEVSAPAEVKSGKISKKDAEALFAEQFSTSAASAVKEEPKHRELTPADNDFWGIPDEPEISFTPKAPKGSAFGAKSAPKAVKEAEKEKAEPVRGGEISEEIRREDRAGNRGSSRDDSRNDNRNDSRGGRGRRRENDFVPAESAFIPMEEKKLPESEPFGMRRERNGRDRGRRGRRDFAPEENSTFAAPEDAPVKEWEPRQEQPARDAMPAREIMPEREPRMEREPRQERNFAQNRENGNREMPGRGRRMRESFDRSAGEPMRNESMRNEPMRNEPAGDEMPQGQPVQAQNPPERMSRPSDEEIERAFPSWQEAISQVIRFNIDRHKQRQGDHGPRRR